MNNLIYVASAYAGDIKGNIEKAKRYCVHVINEGGIPIAPHLLFTQFLDDSVASERQLGLDLGLDLLKHCTEVWVFGDVSGGMRQEIELAEKIEKPIRWFDADCSDITELKEIMDQFKQVELLAYKWMDQFKQVELLAYKWFDGEIDDRRMAEAVFGLINGGPR